MKDRMKRFCGRAVAVVSALLFVASSFQLIVFADDPVGNVVDYSLEETLNFIGHSVSGYYQSTSGMKKISFELQNVRWNSYVSTNGSSFDLSLKRFAVYSAPYPSDMVTSGAVICDLGLKFSNCYYMELYCGGAHNSSFYRDGMLTTVRPLNYVTIGDSRNNNSYHYITADIRSGRTTRPNAVILTAQNTGVQLANVGIVGGAFSFSQRQTVDVGELCFSYPYTPSGQYDQELWFCVSNISTNTDAVFLGGSYFTSQGLVSGDISGTITDSSGNSSDLNIPNVNLDVNIDVPDYSSKLDDLENAINPSLDSSQADIYNRFDSEGEEYNTLENSLLDNMASQIDNMDSIAFEFDPTYVEEAEDFTPLFNYPLVMWMTNLVLIISLISFLIFGKWV